MVHVLVLMQLYKWHHSHSRSSIIIKLPLAFCAWRTYPKHGITILCFYIFQIYLHMTFLSAAKVYYDVFQMKCPWLLPPKHQHWQLVWLQSNVLHHRKKTWQFSPEVVLKPENTFLFPFSFPKEGVICLHGTTNLVFSWKQWLNMQLDNSPLSFWDDVKLQPLHPLLFNLINSLR